MLIFRNVVWMFSLSMMALGSGMVSGQNFPNKVIRMVTSEAGGGTDLAARIVAPALVSAIGQQVIVDNRGSLVAAQTVGRAPPDGYTLLVAGNPLWILPLLQSVPFDPVQDFSPVALVSRAPSIVVVHPSVAVNSVQELISLAKGKPGALNYASASTGSTPHLAMELFKYMTGINIMRINYKGSGAALNGLIGSQVQMMIATSGSVDQHIKSGKLRALAVTSAEPSTLLPGLPTVSASGVPGYESVAMFGIFSPARTPSLLIKQLNRDIASVLDRPDVKERFSRDGSEAVGGSPEQFAAAVKSEMAKMGKLIKDAGIRAD